MFSIRPRVGTLFSFSTPMSFSTVSIVTFEGVVTRRNSHFFISLIISSIMSPIPGGISMTKKSSWPHIVIARSSMRAFEISKPLKGEGLSSV